MLSPRWVGREQVFLRVYSVWNAEAAAAERARRRRVGASILDVVCFGGLRWSKKAMRAKCSNVVGEDVAMMIEEESLAQSFGRRLRDGD